MYAVVCFKLRNRRGPESGSNSWIGMAIHLAPVRAGDGFVILEVEVHGAPHSIRVALERAGVAIAEVPAHGELGQRNRFPLVRREHPLLDIAGSKENGVDVAVDIVHYDNRGQAITFPRHAAVASFSIQEVVEAHPVKARTLVVLICSDCFGFSEWDRNGNAIGLYNHYIPHGITLRSSVRLTDASSIRPSRSEATSY